ncbi:hypothetical protein [Streptomyces alboflavus]|uniref:hypothetical protein n=1 Tax=Streptomyces alboflavus TaxID=67267 RepID=UPI0036A0F743
MSTAPAALDFTEHPDGTHGFFASLTAPSRHGEHLLTEESFAWTYTLKLADRRRVGPLTMPFREYAEQLAAAVEASEQAPDIPGLFALKQDVVRAARAKAWADHRARTAPAA